MTFCQEPRTMEDASLLLLCRFLILRERHKQGTRRHESERLTQQLYDECERRGIVEGYIAAMSKIWHRGGRSAKLTKARAKDRIPHREVATVEVEQECRRFVSHGQREFWEG